MASKKKMSKIILSNLVRGRFYTKTEIADIIDKSGILSANDYNPPKSGNTINANWEITLGYLLSEMVKSNKLNKINKEYEIP